ncbi:MAG: cobalamin-binding protein [Moraxellaceae bacterium]|nr:cobalamin-binding protein [Moraxellaceae bacterium]
MNRFVVKMLTPWLLALAVVFPVQGQAQAFVVRDDAGREHTLARPVQRAIALAPSLTELIFAAGGGERLLGVVEYSDYPAAARNLPRVGSNQKLDLERIATLKPDMIFVWYHGNGQREIERLRAMGIPMFYLEPKHLDDLPAVFERLGRLFGTEAVATGAATRYRTRLASQRARHAGVPKVRTFYQIWSQPLMTINGTHLISDVMALCGGENVFADQPMLVPRLSTESVVAANPEVILAAHRSRDDADLAPLRDPQAQSLAHWQRYTGMQAVKNGQMWTIPGDLIARHGPRILDAADAVCTALDAVRAAR